MPEEKIGEDVLGGTPPSRMPLKKRKELEQKLKEELAKKKAKEKAEEEELEKLPKLPPIPGEKPPEMSEEEWQELQMRARLTGQLLEKDVHVDEHFRSKPKKKSKSLADTVFEFP